MFLYLAFKAKKHTDLLSLPGTLKTYYKIDIFSAVISLRSKRFSASSSRKLGREQKRKKKRKKKNDGGGGGGGGGERRKLLPANPTILKICVCPRT